MFERFTQDARDAVVAAQAVARAESARSIDSRHLLIAMVETPGPAATALTEVGVDPAAFAASLRSEGTTGGLDADALASVGIDLEAVRQRADVVFGEGALDRGGRRPAKGHIPFTRDAKKALELALREAIRLSRNRIDSAMLLLGILRSTGSPAQRALQRTLTEHGSSVVALRAAVEESEAQAS